MQNKDSKKLPIIAFSFSGWDTHWMGRQHVLSRLGKRGWSILYSNGVPYFGNATQKSLRGSTEYKNNVELFYPGKIIPRNYRFSFLDRLAIKYHCRQLKKALNIGKNDPFIVVCFNPSFLPYVEELNPTHCVYYMHDLYHLIGEKDISIHEKLVERSELVTAVTDVVWDEMIKDPSRERKITENGVDSAIFEEEPVSSEASDKIEQLPKPRIGYLGAINRKLDYVLMLQLAKTFKDCQFIFIGKKVIDPIKKNPQNWQAFNDFFALENVSYVGAVQREEIPYSLSLMDINIAPYLVDKSSWAYAALPLKIPEYLCSGKPAISAYTQPLEEHYSDYVEICNTPDDWEKAIEKNLAGHERSDAEGRKAHARKYDWDITVEKLESYLEEMIGMQRKKHDHG